MKRSKYIWLAFITTLLTACGELSNTEVESLLSQHKVYPKDVEIVLFCNTHADAKNVINGGLVKNGFVTAQLQHTMDDIGKPLIYFTEKAQPYLIVTSDTLKSFDEQKIRVGKEQLERIVKIETNSDGNRAVVDYVTVIKEQNPFSVLYPGDINAERERRTSFSLTDTGWQWDGRVIKMPANRKKKE